ncbi:hypothetical protein Moror_17917 [Moniliophthora roreri MCA 2997]|uniref:Uncharacterized protein n=1 Tax=Moniliophthora roreri (strain MCA 2997) TaxID=1381753 RepID=V2XTV9_MONRO|nr:hypothetical protein Moror_17917 [Moniliophthora roreri MCA 2997]
MPLYFFAAGSEDCFYGQLPTSIDQILGDFLFHECAEAIGGTSLSTADHEGESSQHPSQRKNKLHQNPYPSQESKQRKRRTMQPSFYECAEAIGGTSLSTADHEGESLPVLD